MNQQTVLFLQALWDVNIQKAELERISIEAAQYDLASALRGAMDYETLWVSDQAVALKKQVLKKQKQLNEVKAPYQLLPHIKEYQSLIGQIQALQIKTMQTLNSPSGPLIEDTHIIVRQLQPFAESKYKEQTLFQLYRVLVLAGINVAQKVKLPTHYSLEALIDFNSKVLKPVLDNLDDEILDGRWAYEKRTVRFQSGITFEQYVAVEPTQTEINQIIGIPRISTGDEGNLRICGRGYITNLRPDDILSVWKSSIKDGIQTEKFYRAIVSDTELPQHTLSRYYGQKKYLVSPSTYFQKINMYIISDTFQRRVKQGMCFFCGSPFYHGICKKCQRKQVIN